MAEITAASAEQSSGIELVNQAITQMDDVTQQNAALVEEATAAAESLEDQAQKLAVAVAMFNTGAGQAVRAAPAATRAASAAKTPVARKSAPVSPPKAPAKRADLDEEWEEF